VREVRADDDNGGRAVGCSASGVVGLNPEYRLISTGEFSYNYWKWRYHGKELTFSTIKLEPMMNIFVRVFSENCVEHVKNIVRDLRGYQLIWIMVSNEVGVHRLVVPKNALVLNVDNFTS
jgi:hypothetical protein